MELGIRGKIALVTGGGRGIGRACALTLAQEGAVVCVNELTEQAGEETVHEICAAGGRALCLAADVSNAAQVDAMFQTLAARLGPVDILINNAAYSPKTPFEDITPEEFLRVVQVNLVGAFVCAQRAFEQMKPGGWGRIVSLSSMAGLFGANKAGVHYASSKAGIVGMTLSLAKMMGPHGVTVNCVAPGRIDTELTRVLPPETIAQIASEIPLGRIGTVEETADAIVFLASEQASYINGTCLEVLGGYIA